MTETFIQKIFSSCKNSENKKHKVFTICGIKIKFKINRKKINKQTSYIMDFLYHTEIAKSLHPIIFEKYKNINLGKDIVIYACGPSAKHYSQIDNAFHIAINRAFYVSEIKFDCIFIHDEEVITENYDLIKNYPADKFCAYHTSRRSSNMFHINSSLISSIKAKRFFISNPHISSISSDLPDVINPDITKGMFMDRGGGTVFSALQFALYTNPRRIFLVGCDCTSNGYFYSRNNNKEEEQPEHWKDKRDGKNILLKNIIKVWGETATVTKMLFPDTEIISINPVSLKGLFKDVYTKSFLNENPELTKENNINIL